MHDVIIVGARCAGSPLALLPLNDALADFEKKRNQASAADYQQNIAAARFTPFPPEFLAVRAAVRIDRKTLALTRSR
jgi:hypothetical protein